MTRLSAADVRRLGQRARAQIAGDDPRIERRAEPERQAIGDVGTFRCATCGNVEAPIPGVRKHALTRAEEHADRTKHARIELVINTGGARTR